MNDRRRTTPVAWVAAVVTLGLVVLVISFHQAQPIGWWSR